MAVKSSRVENCTCIMEAQGVCEHTLPVFALNNALPAFDKKDFSTAEVCASAEKTAGFNSVIGAQKISGLWRIYPRDKGARQKLLIQGMTVRGVQVTVKEKNPYLIPSLDGKEEEVPATKVIVGNVPISYSDQEIVKSVQELGCTLRSKLILERDRDERGKLTHWLTGRRIIYVSIPREPLPKHIQVGPFRASVYHREQKDPLREAAAECRKCLQKGQHKTADCPNPVKCRQCFADGHKAGDNVCSLTAEANSNEVDDSNTFFTQTKIPPNQPDKRHASRQANRQNNTLITDYTTTEHHKKSNGSGSQRVLSAARGRSPGRQSRPQNRAPPNRDDSLKRPRSPTGDTPPTDRRARLKEVANMSGDEDSASEEQ